MQVTTRLRLPEDTLEDLKATAKANRKAVSEALRGAMIPYLKGEKRLAREPAAKETTVTMYVEDMTQFRALAEEANVPFNEAMRVLVSDYLHEHQS